MTYGDYSGKVVKNLVCHKCRQVIKKHNLQLLLDQDETLCPTCAPAPKRKPVVGRNNELEDVTLIQLAEKRFKSKSNKPDLKRKQKRK